MSDKPWIFDERSKGLEDAYFRQKEVELAAKLREASERRSNREQLSSELAIEDQRVLDVLEQLGITRETLPVLHLVPLVQVAWSDGHVMPSERKKILDVAGVRGITPGTPTYAKLVSLLDRRPTEEMFDAVWRVIRTLIASAPQAQRESLGQSLSAYATQIALASGGVLGFNAITKAEQETLDRVAQEIADAHAEAARKVLGDGGGRTPA